MASDLYRKGDHYLTCDRSGRQMRASDSRKEWTGLVVHKDEWEARHPQDFVRAVPERQLPPGPVRPVPTMQFNGMLTTTIAAIAQPGATIVIVDSTERFLAGDYINIGLDNDEMWRVLLNSVNSGTELEIAETLPRRVSIGNSVVNLAAMAAPNIG